MSNIIKHVAAGADLRGQQYKAVAVGGTIAATAQLAMGLLQNKPNTGEDASVQYFGESFYVAGGAVTAGGLIGVTTSGFCITVDSGSVSIGKALNTVTSGSQGRALVNLITPFYVAI